MRRTLLRDHPTPDLPRCSEPANPLLPMKRLRYPALLAVGLLALTSFASAADDWRPLFDGTLDGWRHWLGAPHKSAEVPGIARDAETGEYQEPLGWDADPLNNFDVKTIDGEPAIYISGQGMGILMTNETFENYHLRLQFKWGEKKWPPRDEVVRDSGLLYHVHGEPGRSSRYWPACVELQIQEQDCGDLYAIITQISVNARTQTGANNRPAYIYDPAGAPTIFKQERPIGNRCIKSADFEKPHGEWNTIELICLGDDSIHIVNGEVVMRLSDAKQQDGDGWGPLSSGHIVLQSEGAEIYFRNVEIRPLTEVPSEFATN